MGWAAVPVVFVLFGPAPLYLLCNIEQTLRRNPVIVLGDDVTLLPPTVNVNQSSSLTLTVEKSAPYMSGARDFAVVYKHMCGGDDSPGRVRRELQNFQRWYVLRDYMRANRHLDHVFFSDGDSVLFGNATQALADRRECDSVINVEYQPGVLHMVAAGESSLWGLPALDSFCDYTMSVYQSSAAVKALQVKNQIRPAVVDMTLLWLWWVSQKDASDPDTSWIVPKWLPPPTTKSPQPLNSQEVAASRSKNLLAFRYAKSLPLPNATLPLLHLCNGLDVVANTLFDHMHAWMTNPKRFSLPVNDGGLPCTSADRGMHGGRPALNSTSPGDGRICFLNVHYQGNYKEQLGRDVCRLLLPIRGPPSRVVLPEVRQACSKEWGRRPLSGSVFERSGVLNK